MASVRKTTAPNDATSRATNSGITTSHSYLRPNVLLKIWRFRVVSRRPENGFISSHRGPLIGDQVNGTSGRAIQTLVPERQAICRPRARPRSALAVQKYIGRHGPCDISHPRFEHSPIRHGISISVHFHRMLHVEIIAAALQAARNASAVLGWQAC